MVTRFCLRISLTRMTSIVNLEGKLILSLLFSKLYNSNKGICQPHFYCISLLQRLPLGIPLHLVSLDR